MKKHSILILIICLFFFSQAKQAYSNSIEKLAPKEQQALKVYAATYVYNKISKQLKERYNKKNVNINKVPFIYQEYCHLKKFHFEKKQIGEQFKVIFNEQKKYKNPIYGQVVKELLKTIEYPYKQSKKQLFALIDNLEFGNCLTKNSITGKYNYITTSNVPSSPIVITTLGGENDTGVTVPNYDRRNLQGAPSFQITITPAYR